MAEDLQGLEVNINLDVLQGGYLTGKGSNGLNGWISFDNEVPPYGKVADYTITTGFDIRNITKDARNYVSFDVYGVNHVAIDCKGYHPNSGTTGEITLGVNESGADGTGALTTIWQTTKDLGESYTFSQDVTPAFFGHYTLAPQTSLDVSNKYLLYWFNHVLSTNLNDEFYFTLGKAIFNSNPATYIPDGIRKQQWLSLNPNGNIKLRKDGWQEFAIEQNATVHQVNRGYNRIRKSNGWIQRGVFDGQSTPGGGGDTPGGGGDNPGGGGDTPGGGGDKPVYKDVLVADVSKVNPDSLAFFKDLASKGVKAVIVQLTAGTNIQNPLAANQVANARKAGLRVHAYHYSYEDGYDEVAGAIPLFVQRCKEVGIDPNNDYVFFDEEDAQYNPNPATDDCNTWLDLMAKNGFKNCGIYSGAYNFLGKGHTNINPTQLHTNILWVANYGVDMPGVDNTTIWQFADTFGGYSLDINYDFNGVLLGGAVQQVEQPQVTSEPVFEQGHGTVVEGETVTSIANTLNHKFELNLSHPVDTFVANNPQLFTDGDINHIYPGQKYVFYYTK